MIRRFRLASRGVEITVRVLGEALEVQVGEEIFSLRLEHHGGNRGLILMPEGVKPLWFARLKRGTYQIFFAGREHTVVLEDPLQAAVSSGLSRDGREELVAPIPGRVVQVLVAPGAEVAAGTPVVVLEAMKMQNLIATHGGGRVQEIKVKEGAIVEAGQLLVVVG